MTCLVDSSAWIEFLRGTDHPVVDELSRRLEVLGGVSISGTVEMEILAGARTQREVEDLKRLLARAAMAPTDGGDFALAASLYRTCRADGVTIRRLSDCLIAATAIRLGLPVLHADRDFDALASSTALMVVSI